MRDKRIRGNNITVVGAGQVGSAFAAGLHYREDGHGKNIAAVISHTEKSAAKLAKEVRAKIYSTSLKDIPSSTDVIILALPSPAIGPAVRELSKLKNLNWKRIGVFHTSGADGAALLRPLAKLGCATAAIHPIQTFPRSTPVRELYSLIDRIPFGIEYAQGSRSFALGIAKALRGTVVEVPARMRPLYHAMCVFASGFVVEMLHTIEEMCRRLKINEEWDTVISRLLYASIENALHSSPAAALTGPFVRGDTATIQKHLAALKKTMPEALEMYKALATASAGTARKLGRIDRKKEKEILGVVKGR